MSQNENNFAQPPFLLKVVKLKPDAKLPERKSKKAAGYDLYAYDDAVLIPSRDKKSIRTGIGVEMPEGMCGVIKSRSGLIAKKDSIVAFEGLIDPDYQGELTVILINHGLTPYYVKKGDRIAQLLLFYYGDPEVMEVPCFAKKTERGTNGFGSTGLSG
jgi:dUTP pyrophosphatase